MTINSFNAASFKTSAGFNDERILCKCECTKLRAELSELKNIVLKLEKDFKDSVESHFNREVFFRESVDFKICKLEESVKDAVATLEREVVECFKRRDNKLAKELKKERASVATVSPPASTASPVPPTISPGIPPTNSSTISTTSRTVNRAMDRDHCATVPAGPDFHFTFSVLPFSRQELCSTQARDDILQGLTISPPTAQTTIISVRSHQGLLYRHIQKEDGQGKIQLIIPQALVPQTIQHLHYRSEERHQGKLKTLLRILEVAWWPTIRKDVWAFITNCESCGVENKEYVVTNSHKQPQHQRHHRSSANIHHQTHKPERRKHQGEWRASGAGCTRTLGGKVPSTQGHSGWYWIPPLYWISTDSSGKLVPMWAGLARTMNQGHLNAQVRKDTHFMDNG